jgi:hypothetical protein
VYGYFWLSYNASGIWQKKKRLPCELVKMKLENPQYWKLRIFEETTSFRNVLRYRKRQVYFVIAGSKQRTRQDSLGMSGMGTSFLHMVVSTDADNGHKRVTTCVYSTPRYPFVFSNFQSIITRGRSDPSGYGGIGIQILTLHNQLNTHSPIDSHQETQYLFNHKR